MHDIQVGDKVRLTGADWKTYEEGGVSVGATVAVTEISIDGIWAGEAGTVGNLNGLYSESNPDHLGDYSCELVSGNSEEATHNRAKSFAIIDEATISDEMYEAVKNTTRINGVDLSPESKRVNFELNVRRITDQIADLLISKNLSYGDAALNPIRVFSKSDRIGGLYQRIDDKLSRVSRGTEYPGDDTVKDLIGYLCLLLIARESE